MEMRIKMLSLIMLFMTIISFCNTLYFDLKPQRKKCFIEELYVSNMAMIKYTITDMPADENGSEAQYLSNIDITVVSEDDDNDIYIDKVLVDKQGKFSMTASNDGQYRVCVTNSNPAENIKAIKMNIQILSDNMDEPNLEGAVTSDHVITVHEEVQKIISKGEKYSRRQEKILKFEEKDFRDITRLQKIFYYMTLIQIVVVLGLGIYQLLNLKNYLDKNVLDF